MNITATSCSQFFFEATCYPTFSCIATRSSESRPVGQNVDAAILILKFLQVAHTSLWWVMWSVTRKLAALFGGRMFSLQNAQSYHLPKIERLDQARARLLVTVSSMDRLIVSICANWRLFECMKTSKLESKTPKWWKVYFYDHISLFRNVSLNDTGLAYWRGRLAGCFLWLKNIAFF